MPKISVIVAVYCAEKSLCKCLDSLDNQTFKDYEVILVDDGSVDSSGLICDNYAHKHSNVVVVHKKNGGVSSARQCGMENASGEYVIHIDPDDWVEPNMLEEMYASAVLNSSDMVICDFIFHYQSKLICKPQKPKSLNHRDVMREFFFDLHGSCCNKLIKRECFVSNNLLFPTNLVVWEDLFVCVCLTFNPIRISYVPKAFYHYICYSNDNSLVKVVSRKKLNSMLFFIDYFESKDGFDISLLLKRKIEAKRTAFLLRDMKKDEFVGLLPETNVLFENGFGGFKKLDSLIRFSLGKSWRVSRILLSIWKLKFSVEKKIRKCL
ncbi:Glycosyltransferase involved in cell wall bisynthesis [Fibrobacter sp. UWR3]|uniref:glycosyltransferase family 2 protein n=1 Tax=Fibrobacter sp. UWR3 TaxID=1896217 RepID=UPI000920088A|nr:glycosyltransferase [Fibrobacter sp. UWR3]SHN02691.1 Glycosyltransferase involved in cell wall bisynthesis [Fibrobacter sp. UWR3]